MVDLIPKHFVKDSVVPEEIILLFKRSKGFENGVVFEKSNTQNLISLLVDGDDGEVISRTIFDVTSTEDVETSSEFLGHMGSCFGVTDENGIGVEEGLSHEFDGSFSVMRPEKLVFVAVSLIEYSFGDSLGD